MRRVRRELHADVGEQIRSEDSNPRSGERGKRRRCRVPEPVLPSAGKQRPPGSDSGEKLGSAAAAAAMMTDFKKICPRESPLAKESALGGGTRVPRQESAPSIPFEDQHQGLIVGRIGLGSWSARVDRRKPRIGPGQGAPRREHGRADPATRGHPFQVMEEVCLVLSGRMEEDSDGKLLEDRKEAERVVRMGMRQDRGV